MSRKIAIVMIVAAVAIALLWATPASAKVHHPNEVYYNYYGPVAYDGTSAPLYVSPRPVPAYVGHTTITYAPLQPHEYLYPHSRTYIRHDGCGSGFNVTRVRYGHRFQPFMKFRPAGRTFMEVLNFGSH
ncbi:MAG: hypothetical protein PVH19_03820 [Planctomycetia bacterium]|jgi:hypothetical protein